MDIAIGVLLVVSLSLLIVALFLDIVANVLRLKK